MAGNVEDFTPGGVFQGENINFTVNTASSSTTVNTFLESATFNEATNILRLQLNNGTAYDVDLSALDGGGGGGTDTNNYVTAANFDPDSNILTLNREGLSNVTVDLSALAGGGTDTNDYVDSIAIDPGTDQLRLGRTGELSDLTVSLTQFANIDNQATGTAQFTQGDYTYTIMGDVLTVTDADAPSPAFDPEESNPDPVNALDATEVVFDAPEANEGFEIADVEVTNISVKDTDGMSISTDTNLATVNSDNTITIDLADDAIDSEAIGDIELTVEITDTDGITATVEPMADLFVPYYTLSSNTDYTSLTDFQDDAVESSEAIGSSVTISGVGQGRKKYWIMTNGTYTFMQQGFMLEATIVTTGKIGAYTYNLYDLGEFGNPFDSTEASPDITLDVS